MALMPADAAVVGILGRALQLQCRDWLQNGPSSMATRDGLGVAFSNDRNKLAVLPTASHFSCASYSSMQAEENGRRGASATYLLSAFCIVEITSTSAGGRWKIVGRYVPTYLSTTQLGAKSIASVLQGRWLPGIAHLPPAR